MEPLGHEEVGRLYRAHRDGDALTDPQWIAIEAWISRYAHRAIRDAARRYKIPEFTREALHLQVTTDVLGKFCRRTLPEARNTQALFRKVFFRQIVDKLRRIRSAPVGRSGGAEKDMPCERLGPREESADDFAMIRAGFRTFRFQTHHLVREMLLAHLLMKGGYPEPKSLMGLVAQSEIHACFNAAVFDINVAIDALRGPDA